jgi:glycosyltransferase involved in cell wall biosynthesis
VATVRYHHTDESFNYSEAINRGAARAGGDVLLLLNDDMELITPDWIEQFLGFLQEPDVGAVGGKYYYEDDGIQHAGVATVGTPSHLFHQVPRGTTRMLGTHLTVTREVTALTAACLAVRRGNYLAVGGFTEQLPSNYNDIDFCLKLRSRGLRNIWTPHVELYHFESQSRRPGHVDPVETELLERRWGSRLLTDPYYNPNLITLAPTWEPYSDWEQVARGWRQPVYSHYTIDHAGYLDVNTDLAAVMAADPEWDLVEHFKAYGAHEGRMQTLGLRHRPQRTAPPDA